MNEIVGQRHMLYLLSNFIYGEFRHDPVNRNKLMVFIMLQWGLLSNKSSSEIQKDIAPYLDTDKRTQFEKDMMKDFKITKDENTI